MSRSKLPEASSGYDQSSELLLHLVCGELAKGKMLHAISAARFTTVSLCHETLRYEFVQTMTGRTLKNLFRKVEKEAMPVWMEPKHAGLRFEFTGFRGTPLPRVLPGLGPREAGRPKKVRPARK